MSKTIARVWQFTSDSNPSKSYETLQYTDGTTSCNCMGWTRRCVNGYRTCKHTRAVEMGTADSLSVAHTSYQAQGAAKQEPKYSEPQQVKKSVPLPIRKVRWK